MLPVRPSRCSLSGQLRLSAAGCFSSIAHRAMLEGRFWRLLLLEPARARLSNPALKKKDIGSPLLHKFSCGRHKCQCVLIPKYVEFMFPSNTPFNAFSEGLVSSRPRNGMQAAQQKPIASNLQLCRKSQKARESSTKLELNLSAHCKSLVSRFGRVRWLSRLFLAIKSGASQQPTTVAVVLCSLPFVVCDQSTYGMVQNMFKLSY